MSEDEQKEEEVLGEVVGDGEKQLCLKGVNKYHKEKQIRREFEQLLGEHVRLVKEIQKPKMKPVCFVSFESKEDKQVSGAILHERHSQRRSQG